ncbi:MAG: DUF1641 domain-containing protein [Candidatus Nanopelagicales bacterium]|jgi:uncharacterized protein YjgD (DUF1641 family)|nr:DUF1641 domain-containing protein [Candidatus Nanopelagicales bacterium]MCU0295668.1 DUF1641 domain-containing protein [Candidatus Nanopelagicales bacterium]MCU0297459.1 DUF1641 domain-containing protein [Candidatus Nanopelagicales bacterium]
MTAVAVTTEERLDAMSAQMDFIVEELQRQRAARERISELAETLTPVTKQAMQMATDQLQDMDMSSDELVSLLRTFAANVPQMQALLAQLGPLSELAEQVSHLSGPALAKATEVLAVADDKGYFAFARESSKIADRVVTEFTEDDVKALGDNVVTILTAVKEMTQPEVMGLVQRTALSVQDAEDTPMEPPSMFALLKSMRDPQTRRGLAKVMAMLHTVGEEHPPTPTEGRK